LNPKEEAFEPVLEPMPNTNFTDDIRSRLDALKNSGIPEDPPVEGEGDANTVDDIQKRLANLKGVEYKDYSSSNKVLFTTDTRSEQAKIDDLLKQFVDERTIDDEATPEPDHAGTIGDIEKRLAALRGQDLEKTKQQIEQTEETEEDEIARTMKQYLEEATLEDIELDPDEAELVATIPAAPGQKKDLEELPFCEICNEDAVLRCLECENLFCRSCYKEFHEEEDYKTHKTKPYQAPKSNDL
jgi:abscission/NoCut checkpoint regulator